MRLVLDHRAAAADLDARHAVLENAVAGEQADHAQL